MAKAKIVREKPLPGDYLSYAAVRGLQLLLKFLSPAVCWHIGKHFGTLCWMLSPRYRALLRRNLRIVYDNRLQARDLQAKVRLNFQHTFANWCAAAKTFATPSKHIGKVVSYNGLEHLRESFSKGQGVLVIIPHMSNWELLTRLRPWVPECQQFASLYRPLPNPLVEGFVRRRRQQDGVTMIAKSTNMQALVTTLKSNGMLGVLVDQHVGHEGIMVPWFGKLASSTSISALLHLRTKCALHPVSIVCDRPGHWQINFQPALDTAGIGRDVIGLTSHINKALENCLKVSLDEGFWLHNRWKPTDQPLQNANSKKGDYHSKLLDKPNYAVLALPSGLNHDSQRLQELLQRLLDARSDLQLCIIAGKQLLEHLPRHAALKHALCYDEQLPQQLQSLYCAQGPLDWALLLEDDHNLLTSVKALDFCYSIAPDSLNIASKCDLSLPQSSQHSASAEDLLEHSLNRLRIAPLPVSAGE